MKTERIFNRYHEVVLHGGEKCEWTAFEYETVMPIMQMWQTSCKEIVEGEEMMLVHGFADKTPPSVHHYKFCPYCGREIDEGDEI
jgi:hypothetical protein